jgi:hypothetical protein
MHTAQPTDAIVTTGGPRPDRSQAGWKLAAIGFGAGLAGLLVGGMSTQPSAHDYSYVATGDTIYRIDRAGRIEYLRVENGVRSADGYFGWGEVRIDPARRYSPKPQP